MLQSQTLVNQLWELSLNYPDTVSWSASVLSGGNIITTGNTFNSIAQKANIVTAKTDQSGSVVWQTEYNGTESEFDYGAAVTVDGSGNIFVTGASHSSDDYTFDVVVIKYNSSGVQQWATTFNGTGSSNDIPSDILLIGSDIYVCAASVGSTTNYDYLLLKLNASGVVQWNKRYDYASLYDIPGHLATNGSDIVVSGASQSTTTNWDYTSLKYNTSGTVLNTKRTTAAGYGFDRPTGLVVDADDNFYITGYTFNGSNYDMRTIKLDDDLSTIWTKTENGGAEDGSNSICIDANANTYIAGFSESSAGNKLMRIIKYDSSGTKLWTKTLQNSSNDIDAEASAITFNASSNKVIVTGFYTYTTGKKVITTYALNSNNGNLNWKKDYPNLSASIDIPTNVLTNNNFIWVYGRRTDDDTTRYVTVKYETYELSTENILDSLGNPICRDNQLIVHFNPQLLDKDFIDNKHEVFANLESILEDTTYDKIAQLLKGTNTQFTPKAIKIYKLFTSNDTTSITRTGDTIKLPEFWASLLVTSDNSINCIGIIDTLMSFSNEISWTNPNLVFHSDDSADDPLYTEQNSLHFISPNDPDANIEIEGAWNIETGNENIGLGVIDWTIDYLHEDFMYGSYSKVVSGYDFTTGAEYPVMDIPTDEDGNHGTNVAGIIGALRNNSIPDIGDAGIAGIAGGDQSGSVDNLGVSLVTLNIYPSSSVGATLYSISEAMVTGAVSGEKEYQGLNIMNCSQGQTDRSLQVLYDDDLLTFAPEVYIAELSQALEIVYQNEVIFVASRGNLDAATEDFDEPYLNYPSSFLYNHNFWVICVGAAGVDGERKTPENSNPDDVDDQSFSIIGGGIDLIAPGSNAMITTTGLMSDEPYEDFNNTSAAAAHVSGVAALMLSHVNENPLAPNKLAPEDVEWILQESADNFTTSIHPEEYDNFTGHGMLNATRALEWVKLPDYKIYHYGGDGWEEKSVYHSVEEEIFLVLPFSFAGLSVATYQAEAWDCDFTFNHELPFGASLEGWWLRNSTTKGLYPTVLLTGATVGGEQILYNDSEVIEPITSTQAKIKTRLYKIVKTFGGSDITDVWYPMSPDEATVNYSLWVSDPLSVSIQDQESITINNDIIVYPNPALDMINFVSHANEQVTLSIMSSTGEFVMILKDYHLSETNSVSIASLSTGMYFLTITTNNQLQTIKFIKQ